MSRPDPIQYAERLYAAIRDANFSPISFFAFGNAVKDGVSMRNMPRIAAEPFMRVVGEMLDMEEAAEADSVVIDADVTATSEGDDAALNPSVASGPNHPPADAGVATTSMGKASEPESAAADGQNRRRNAKKR